MLNPILTRALALAFVLMPSQAEEPKATDSADPDAIRFSRDIAPILVRKCVACHGPEKSKGGYRLDTFELLMKGGESKSPSVTPGQPAESQLFRLITAEDADDRMPQKDEPLPSAQIEVIERWIRQGAQFDGPDPKAALATLIPRVPHPDAPAVYRRPVPIMHWPSVRTDRNWRRAATTRLRFGVPPTEACCAASGTWPSGPRISPTTRTALCLPPPAEFPASSVNSPCSTPRTVPS